MKEIARPLFIVSINMVMRLYRRKISQKKTEHHPNYAHDLGY